MCTYYKENKEIPCCTHSCSGCVWHEEDEEDENE